MPSSEKVLRLLAFGFATSCLSMAAIEADEGKPSRSSSSNPMVLEIEINRPTAGRRYRSPYVAVWLEDKDKFPVRTIALWLMKDRPGPRWHADLRQWYKSDRVRMALDGDDLVDGMSGATRAPGKYKVGWDGKGYNGKPLPVGTYTLYIEAVREHGTYQLIKQEMEIGDRPLKKALEGNEEIKAVEVTYEPVVTGS
ncbi:MAG: DUF2271 domain-containing protein [Rubripirellula sp.]